MMEVLLTDNLVDSVNNTRKKISIKHYLNTYLFPTSKDSNGEDRYPLYFRVIFNKQSVKIKSAINTSYSLTEFQHLKDEDILQIRREALALTNIVSSIYCNIIKAFTDTSNQAYITNLFPENYNWAGDMPYSLEQVKRGFDINQVFNSYDYNQYELPYLVEQKLIEAMADYAKYINDYDDYVGIFEQSKGLNSYQLLQFLKSEKAEWKIFEEQFHPYIWFFNLHYFQFKNLCKEYRVLGATQIDLQYLNFKKMFLEHYPDDNFKQMIENIEHLIIN
ncbi:hypothetical protein Emtol_3199 [Emticicia oligotrophica DSM 17448]|uniref:Uncharacterized protein n=1 Tax=Emticicia oligotrophica (strain DSM 17448 / CIP 109782 / MTCC 6937 / GPTSA100-15) TaxID=929562 RepID=A0ABN4APN4_EMTOG|nr:hypothetical protein [Emticicia oligotrophica]AFK04328.1 hypothetical protein Emtol_3199 [Emticicia oligotrophica DSM 17448]